MIENIPVCRRAFCLHFTELAQMPIERHELASPIEGDRQGFSEVISVMVDIRCTEEDQITIEK